MSQHPYKSRFNEDLINTPTKYFSYILGLIWADGFLVKSKRQHNNTIGIQILKRDMDNIRSNFTKTGKWLCEIPKPTRNRQPTIRLTICNASLRKFLEDHDYHLKKKASACKILNYLPEHLIKYWLLGLIDGDGCLCIGTQTLATRKGKNWASFKLSIHSTYEQNWKYLEDIFKKLNINYIILKRIRSTGKGSEINTTGKMAKKFCDYIYSDTKGLKYLKRKEGKYHKYVKYLNAKH